ncbi:hypothetical protein [Clostridium frigidicarnis]|uniref:Uncharacterized protein n=1 Tax=Clostridium frigidicarnis TaxID=84698 RepID=A0A1I0ZZ05_9CLOT|nr:hypothetical protein [Clostridium frigidicarnis]SFB30797.1 hypothetical protein SAMN04488528_102742 [Clostridium frigidicarnis]
MKKGKFFKKVSLFLFALTTLCIVGGAGANIKTAIARPVCTCPSPDIETVYHENGFTRYHCRNCGWFYDFKY